MRTGTLTPARTISVVGMPELVWDDASADTGRASGLMKRTAYGSARGHAATRAGKKKVIGGMRIPATQRSKTFHNPADRGIHRDKGLGTQFAEGPMNAPLILADQP
jgi:hypothetical protein